MKSDTGKIVQKTRVASQVLVTFVFFGLLYLVGDAKADTHAVCNIFFYLDPLLLLLTLAATHAVETLLLFSLIPVVLTLVLGRFFCGWLCPFGAINQFVSYLASRLDKQQKPLDQRLLKVKYLLLILILMMATLGSNFGSILDPFSLLTRSAAVVVMPSASLLAPELSGIVRDYSAQAEIVGVLFLVLVGLNFYRRRFYCNYLCPLGALYGLVARLSWLRLRPNDDCDGCNLCSTGCTYNGSPHELYSPSECTVCFNCIQDCPAECVDLRWEREGKAGGGRLSTPETSATGFFPERRQVLGAIASGVCLAALPRISASDGTRTHGFLRPPGSVAENSFLERCIRCGECIQACPTNFVQAAGTEAGFEAIWTPVLNARLGYCEYGCNKCTQVCPTGAIEPHTPNQTKQFKIGTAVIDRNRCYTYGDGFNCTVCLDKCPIPDKAIRTRPVAVNSFAGRLVTVNQIYVVPDLCNGCGVCEYVCPRTDQPGIILTSDDEQREYGF